jgi:sodium/proline symporter
MQDSQIVIGAVFVATLVLTYTVALYARSLAKNSPEEDLAGRDLNRWLVGLSAGTTGNSGFIVTGAVGLGYAGGVHWILLPICWLLGDLVYWALFPERLNRLARLAKAATLSEILVFDLTGTASKLLGILVSLLLVVFLSAYTAAQWLAGEKFLSSAFSITGTSSLAIFGASIVLYSSIGGFRGSVYTDLLQAIVRIVGTTIALFAVIYFAAADSTKFALNLADAGTEFLHPFSSTSAIAVVGFVLGFALAAIGFGLGQPQIVSRYFAASSPEEAKAARWIYIGFIQFTWISMTLFGVLLRGVIPGIADPETGLVVFAQQNIWPIATGIIFGDIFATIASTSNGLLVAISQIVTRDLLPQGVRTETRPWMLISMALGAITIGLSLVLPGNVYSIAIDAVSMIGAGLAGPVIIKVFGLRHSATSLVCSFAAGLGAAIIWKIIGFGAILNESGIGMGTSLLVNAAMVWAWPGERSNAAAARY